MMIEFFDEATFGQNFPAPRWRRTAAARAAAAAA
jgi:hypothetical protein